MTIQEILEDTIKCLSRSNDLKKEVDDLIYLKERLNGGSNKIRNNSEASELLLEIYNSYEKSLITIDEHTQLYKDIKRLLNIIYYFIPDSINKK